MEDKKIISEKEKDLVIARLEVLFPDYCFASGSNPKGFSRDEMILEIKNDSETGKDFVKIQMEFLRALKDGSLIKMLNTVTV